LWVHESERIYSDRLVSNDHIREYLKQMGDIVKKSTKYNLNRFFSDKSPEPLIFATFAAGLEGDGF